MTCVVCRRKVEHYRNKQTELSILVCLPHQLCLPRTVDNPTILFPLFLTHELQARGLCEGDAVTHIEGEPLLGSLAVGVSLIEKARDSVALRVQPGGGGAYAGAGFPGKAKFRAVQHVVRQGDSVDALAELYGVTADEVRLWNRKYFPVGEPGFLCPGQVLTLRDTTAEQTRDGHKSTGHRTSPGPSSRRRKSEGDGGRKRMLYQVCEGDSLKSICARLKLNEGEVRGLNRSVFPIGEAGAVFPGQMLTVFAEECDILISEERGGQSAMEDGERAFMQSIAGRKTRRSSLNLGVRGAGVMG